LTYASTLLRFLSSISGVSGTAARGCPWSGSGTAGRGSLWIGGGGGGWLHAIVENFATGVCWGRIRASYL